MMLGQATLLAAARRRNSGFNAASFGATALWISSRRQAAGGAQITDYSGNARHFSQATVANQAAFSATGLNGHPCWVGDGSNDEYTGATWTLPTSGTLMFMGQRVGGGASHRMFEHGANSQITICSGNTLASAWRFNFAGGFGVEAGNNTVASLVVLEWNAAGMNWWINGSPQTSFTAAFTPASATSYLWRFGGGGFRGNFRIGEIVIWASRLDASARATAQTSLGATYGLSL
jgi:hypothetical protein